MTLTAKLRKRGLSVERQVAISIEYEGQRFDEGFRADLIVEGKVIVELSPSPWLRASVRTQNDRTRLCTGSEERAGFEMESHLPVGMSRRAT